MKNTYIFAGLMIMLMLISCKEELIMVPDFEIPPSDRKVLLEELTGVRCPNCPAGAAVVKELKTLYGDKLVPVGVHGDFLTIPLSESKFDFRNEYSQELEQFLEVGPKPAAAINRVRHLQDEFSISTPALWSQYIDEELMKDNTMNILTSHTYDADTRTMDLIVTLVPLIDYSSDENLRISIMLTQNEIEDAQEDPNTVIEEYEHEHVLRTMLTAATGDPINKNLTANQTEQFTYSFTLPSDDDLGAMEPAWIAEHMEIVAFVNVIKEDKKDVIQVESAYLIE